ncbi:hypothetical protein Tco_0741449, partial [Tanacetum coccineum]
MHPMVVRLRWRGRRGGGSCDGEEGEGKKARVGASGVDGRVDRVTRRLFEAHRKTPPEKFFGGGAMVADGGRVVGGGGGLAGNNGEGERVYKFV